MKKEETTFNRCPYDDLIELLCLDVQLSEGEKRKARMHLQQCATCRKKFEELENIYSNLNEEVSRPVTNKALDLAKQIRNKDTKYGLVVCEPVKARKKATASYKTKVVFTANGTGSAKDKKLADFDPRSLPKDSIAIRAMTDKACDKLLLYLWHSNDDDTDGWELKFGKSHAAIFNRAGVSQIPLMEIEDLGDKVIYFKEKHKKASASENRFVNIFESISSQ
ncbi:hypothetical protein JXA02_03885 [candidate division KSB1 bacterium]|nr:hypothetical protein [candidate division KSB1 bacterium]RQW09269.1 MAG: hypothetical protein EH222_04345 [candidate division KSB1 bacterium]